MKQPIYSAQELRAQVLIEINASALPKCNPNAHPIVLLRNSRTAVKRAKSEFKKELTDKTYSIERNAMVHQMVNSNPRFNLVLLVN
jgi:hypothetical protein